MATKWKNRGVGLCFAVGSGFFCALYLIWGSTFFERTATFSEGVETCFERLRWSYVSSLLGDNVDYPDSSFFKNTEACFSEVVSYMENHFSTSLVKDLAPINSLVMNVHWFHKDLVEGKSKIFQRAQFDKLEDARKGIVDRLQSERKRQGRYMEMARKLFFIAWGVALLFFLLSLFVNRVQVQKKSTQEVKQKKETYSVWEKVSLAENLGKILDSLVDKILIQGIRVDLDIGEDSQIYAKNRALHKALEFIFTQIVDSFDGEGHLGISQKYSGDRIVLSLTPFVREHLQGQKEQVLLTLVGECGGRIEEISSRQIKISFAGVSQGHPDKGKRRLLKGKKKEVLRQLSSWQNE